MIVDGVRLPKLTVTKELGQGDRVWMVKLDGGRVYSELLLTEVEAYKRLALRRFCELVNVNFNTARLAMHL